MSGDVPCTEGRKADHTPRNSWGTESGDTYGNGGGYDSGVGTNAGDAELYPYNVTSPPPSLPFPG